MDCSTQGFPVHHKLLKPTQTHVHYISDAIQPSHPLPSFLRPPSIFPSIRVFSNELILHIGGQNIGVSASASVLRNFHSGLTDWLDLLAAQGTLKSLLQHHSSKASILWRSAFFMVQLSHPYMTTANYWSNHSFD